MTLRSVIRGTGSALPARRVDNAEMAQMVDTSDEWIVARTGIRQRHIAGDDETTSTLAIAAARAQVEQARAGVTIAAAFAVLVRASQTSNRKLRDVTDPAGDVMTATLDANGDVVRYNREGGVEDLLWPLLWDAAPAWFSCGGLGHRGLCLMTGQ